MVERQSCKLKIQESIPCGGLLRFIAVARVKNTFAARSEFILKKDVHDPVICKPLWYFFQRCLPGYKQGTDRVLGELQDDVGMDSF